MWNRIVTLLGIVSLTTGCTAYLAGDNTFGQLGVVNSGASSATVDVGDPWVTLEAGWLHTCGRTDQSTVFCWGLNTSGQVGASSGGGTIFEYTPLQVGLAGGWQDISPGGAHTCGVRSGQLWCWGNDLDGQLGNAAPLSSQATPVQVGTSTDWVSVSSGTAHTCGIRNGGFLYCWGDNESGQLGINSTIIRATVPIQVTAQGPWKNVSTGNDHTCGITTQDAIYCWGSNSNGQLGSNQISLGAYQLYPQHPVLRQGPTASWAEVDLGRNFSCAQSKPASQLENPDPFIWCWGDNADGRLPNQPTTDLLTPRIMLTSIGVLDYYIRPSVGDAHMCAILRSYLEPQGGTEIQVNRPFCWGSNTYGQLNISAARTDLVDPAIFVSAGGLHSIQLVDE